jgi:flagellar FliJ protein
MAAPFRLQTVLELAERRLDVATAELQKLRARLQQAQEKLEQLHGYRAEYQASLAAALAQGLPADRLRDFQAFLAKLARAIEAQAAELTRCRQAWQDEHQRWLRLRSREQALQVLRVRHEQSESLRAARVEQKQQDEFALMQERDQRSDPGS